MSLTQKGVARRNQMVYEFVCRMNCPLVITMGGGYPRNDDWTPIIQAHANVYFQAFQFLEGLALHGTEKNVSRSQESIPW
jgi:acetoin utilization deacetylase AcuC-like enzyme